MTRLSILGLLCVLALGALLSSCAGAALSKGSPKAPPSAVGTLGAQLDQPRNPDSVAANAPDLRDLPLEVVEATGGSSEMMALDISGDGGWMGTDKGLSQTLASRGIPVIGLNALHYFWNPKTPETTTEDVVRILRHYMTTWNKNKILLIGYSFGANIVPFVANRLPEDLRSKLSLVVFLSPDESADFKFHLTSWLGRSGKDALPTRPEIEKLRGLKMLCIYGRKDSGAICNDFPPDLLTSFELTGGHRIGGDYEIVADQILQASR